MVKKSQPSGQHVLYATLMYIMHTKHKNRDIDENSKKLEFNQPLDKFF